MVQIHSQIFNMKMENFKSFRTFIDSKIRHFARFPTTNYSGQELHNLLNEILKVHNSFYPTLKAEVIVEPWKGKAPAKYIAHPDYVEVIRYRKSDKHSTPQPFKLRIDYSDFENMVKAIKNLETLNKRVDIHEVAAEYCRVSNIKINKKGENLFNESGFIWGRFFSWRINHVRFTEILNVLELFGLIAYFKGYIVIVDLNKKLDFQTKFTTE